MFFMGLILIVGIRLQEPTVAVPEPRRQPPRRAVLSGAVYASFTAGPNRDFKVQTGRPHHWQWKAFGGQQDHRKC